MSIPRQSKILILRVVFGCSLIAWVWLIPNYVRARSTSAMAACINNLRQIDGAKQQWALENNKTSNDVPTMDDLRVYMGRGPQGTIPRCPAGGTYIPGRVGESPRCSIGGPSHTMDYDDSEERLMYGGIVPLLGLISMIGLVITFVVPLKLKSSPVSA
jgi:hypothetical protein